jgi:hypothetical protein
MTKFLLLLPLVLLATASTTFAQLPAFQDFTSSEAVEKAPGTNLTWVRGGGATAAGPFFAATMPLAMMSDSSASVSFAQLGTAKGLCRITDFLTVCKNPWANAGNDTQQPTSMDFAVLTRDATPAVYQAFPDLRLFPVAASAVAIVHDVQGLTAPLVLSRQLLARM